MVKRMAFPLLAAMLLASSAMLVAGDEMPELGRKLLAKKNFPFSQCVKAGTGSPYLLDGPAPKTVDGVLWIDLTFIVNPEADVTSPAFSDCSNNVKKIDIRSGVKCVSSLPSVWVNGAEKKKGIKWTTINGQDDAVLSLNDLKLGSSIVGSTISIRVSGACNTPATFTGPRGGKLVYFLASSSAVKFCPINSWDWGKSFGQDVTPIGGQGALSIKTQLDGSYYKASDLMDAASSPLASKTQLDAVYNVITAAGLADKVKSSSVTPDVQGTTIGADTTYVFEDETSAFLAGDYLVKKSLAAYVKMAKIPCGSIVSVSTGATQLGTFACDRSRGQTRLNALCLAETNQVCVTPSHGEESSEESSSEEMSRLGASEDSEESSSEGSEESSSEGSEASEESSE